MGEIAAGLYPDGLPGWKEPTTSRDAAKSTRIRAGKLQERVLALLEADGPKTPDEAAEALGKTVLAIRPRFSELIAHGKIERTGTRRTNSSGLMAHEYRVKACQSL